MINRTIWQRWRDLQEDGSAGLLLQLMELFIDTAGKSVTEISLALDKQYAKGVAFHAHALKSSAASLGAEKMAELCLKIETLGREEKLAPVAGLLKELVSEHGLVHDELAREVQILKKS